MTDALRKEREQLLNRLAEIQAELNRAEGEALAEKIGETATPAPCPECEANRKAKEAAEYAALDAEWAANRPH